VKDKTASKGTPPSIGHLLLLLLPPAQTANNESMFSVRASIEAAQC